MKRQLTPTNLKAGAVLYYASAYTDNETKKTEIDAQCWVIRSVKKKRGSQTKHGHACFVDIFDRSDSVYVNMTRKVPYVTTDHKTGGWLASIPEWCRKQFNVTDERLPLGFYTTKTAAFKYAIRSLEEDLKDATKPKDKQQWSYHDPVWIIKKEIQLLKSHLSKLKKVKK